MGGLKATHPGLDCVTEKVLSFLLDLQPKEVQ